eukprot:7684269-Prorocentrum_lima.AAC.1
MTAMHGDAWAEAPIIHRGPCQCGTKTAIVPDGWQHQWQAAMHSSPFSSNHVQTRWRYLGPHLCSRAHGPPARRGWEPCQLRDAANATWERAVHTMERRAKVLMAHPPPITARAR